MALPTGTVTFLFTDIEGSTRLWDQDPETMGTALRRHDTVLREAIEKAGGYVFKTVGDSFCAVFASAKEAVIGAGDAQRNLHHQPGPDEAMLRVRMALHTGECEERDGDYFGPAVNRVARLEATAHGGQVVVSRSAAELVRDHLPLGLSLVDLGFHHLKDIDRSEEIFQLTVDGLPAAFLPLRTHLETKVSATIARSTNLPEPMSSFVGRDTEMAEVVTLLRNHRLVTLTGTGGIGKTRLAIEAGRSLLEETPDGVWLSELATVTDSALVATQVLSDLGIGVQPGKDALDTLVEALAIQSRLVIVDNCEQVLDGCAALVNAIVRSCPDSRFLLTSREPLRIEGEVIYRVPSLSLPPEQVDDLTGLTGSGAVALFLERATSQAPAFELSDDEAPLVADICRRLDGMPLALELATARLRSMSLAKLHDRLEHRFGLLTGGSRIALARQQTLRALVDWSYDLLSGPERALLRRTSVFVGDFDLEAVEGICALDDIPDWDIADLLGSLVDKSLVVVEPHGGEVRYRLQETLRQYGVERLAEVDGADGSASEAARLVDVHMEYYLAFAEEAGRHLEERLAPEWLVRLETDDQNLRTAIDHASNTSVGAFRVLELFWSTRIYWFYTSQPAQTILLLEQALERVRGQMPASLHGRALTAKALILHRLDTRLQLEVVTAALELAREGDDRGLEANALSLYGRSLVNTGRAPDGLSCSIEAVTLARQLDDPVLYGQVLNQYAAVLELSGEAGADIVFLEALAVVEQTGDDLTARSLHNNFSLVLISQDRFSEARGHLEAALVLTGEMTAMAATIYINLGWVSLAEDDLVQAESYFSDSLRMCRLTGLQGDIPYPVLGLACCATRREALVRAAQLHGGADALAAPTSVQWESLEEKFRDRDLATLRERLGIDFERQYDKGLEMRQDEIIKLALSAAQPLA